MEACGTSNVDKTRKFSTMESAALNFRYIDVAIADPTVKRLLIFKSFGSEGDVEAPAPAVERAPAPLPAVDPVILTRAAVLPRAPIPGGIILAKVHGIDSEESLQEAKVHEDVRDVQVGDQVLVVNTRLTTIIPDPHTETLLEYISTTGMDTKHTATIAPIAFGTPESPVGSALEVVIPKTVLKKTGEGVAEPAQNRQAMEKEVPESTFN